MLHCIQIITIGINNVNVFVNTNGPQHYGAVFFWSGKEGNAIGQRRTKRTEFKPFESRNNGGRFVTITIDMLSSPAWAALSVYEQAIYLQMKSKYKGIDKDGRCTSQQITFTHSEGQRHMGKTRFMQTIDKLIETGFIDLVTHLPHKKKATIYGLSSRWHDYGKDTFKQQQRPKLSCPYRGGPKPKDF